MYIRKLHTITSFILWILSNSQVTNRKVQSNFIVIPCSKRPSPGSISPRGLRGAEHGALLLPEDTEGTGRPRSDGLDPTASIRRPRSDGLDQTASIRRPRSDGLDPLASIRWPRSVGLDPSASIRRPRSDGLDGLRNGASSLLHREVRSGV